MGVARMKNLCTELTEIKDVKVQVYVPTGEVSAVIDIAFTLQGKKHHVAVAFDAKFLIEVAKSLQGAADYIKRSGN
jgi:hypothetical protein